MLKYSEYSLKYSEYSQNIVRYIALFFICSKKFRVGPQANQADNVSINPNQAIGVAEVVLNSRVGLS